MIMESKYSHKIIGHVLKDFLWLFCRKSAASIKTERQYVKDGGCNEGSKK